MRLEFKKFFCHRYLVLFVLIIILWNFFFMARQYALVERRSTMVVNEYMMYYPQVKGAKTGDKVAYIKAVKQDMDEKFNEGVVEYQDQQGQTFYPYAIAWTMQYMLNDLEYCYLYKDKNDKLVEDANKRLANMDSETRSEEYMALKKLVERFDGRNIPRFGLTRGYELLFSYSTSVLICILILMAPLSQLFALEREKKYDELVLSPVAKMRWAKRKVKTAVLAGVLLMVGFFVVDIISFYQVFPMDEILNPVYSLKTYRYSVCNMTIAQFMGLNLLLKLLNVVFMVYILVWNSLRSSKAMHAALKNTAVLVALLLVNDWLSLPILPFQLLTNQALFTDFSVMPVAGVCVESWKVYAGLSVLTVMILRILVMRGMRAWANGTN